ncbi:MAG: ABC transporter ATP-binding protein [Steroidobacteraceae bacterium]
MAAFVEVRDLTVTARAADGRDLTLVDGASFEIAQGEVLALIGESGSGKTTIALALLGHARAGCRIAAGFVRVGALEVLSLPPAELAAARGMRIAYVAQSAAAAFNPAHTLMDQVIESALTHGSTPREALEARAVTLFRSLSLPDPEQIGRRYPHQVSGGQLQRVMAAMALLAEPDLVIFDEPTTALDVTTQVDVLRAFRRVLREHGTTAVYVSHDLAVVAQVADRIVVLNRGCIRESGPTAQVLGAPSDDYTRSLVAAYQPVQRGGTTSVAPPPPLLALRGVSAGYGPRHADGLPASLVLREVSLELRRGAALGVIGESGSGKSTLLRAIAGLVPAAQGSIEFDGGALPAGLAQRSRAQFQRIQLVFQDADNALNPAQRVGQIIARPLKLYHGIDSAPAARARVLRMLDLVQLPAALVERYPRELSGGQKQRVNLARALAAEPSLLLCDEVTAALDTLVGAAILGLLAELRRELGLAILYISHDIENTRALCDDVIVLYAGRTVQRGSCAQLGAPPYHPYTRLLIESVPALRTGWLDALPARAAPQPAGYAPAEAAAHAAARSTTPLCPFLARCSVRVAGICDRQPPPVAAGEAGAEFLCHLGTEKLRA